MTLSSSPSVYSKGERRFLSSSSSLRRARRRIVGFLPSAGRSGGGREGDPRFRPVHKVEVGGGPAGGALEVEELAAGVLGSARAISGGGVLRGSTAARSFCGSSRTGAVLELVKVQPDPCRRRIRRLELRPGRRRRLRPASVSRMAVGRWCCRRGRALAVPVHRHKLRRGAADKLCGLFQQGRRSQAAVRRWTAIFGVDAGEEDDVASSPVSPTYCTLLSVFVLCTLYVVLC